MTPIIERETTDLSYNRFINRKVHLDAVEDIWSKTDKQLTNAATVILDRIPSQEGQPTDGKLCQAIWTVPTHTVERVTIWVNLCAVHVYKNGST